jgi:hypothetical protein
MLLHPFLCQCQRTPRNVGNLWHTILIIAHTFSTVLRQIHQVPEDAVRMVTGFTTGMMQSLSGVVLVIPDLADECH